jgi:hypothetical protein
VVDGPIPDIVESHQRNREDPMAKRKKAAKKGKVKVKDLSAKKGSGAVKGGGLRRVSAQ